MTQKQYNCTFPSRPVHKSLTPPPPSLAEYDANCNPGILNEFATAAFRFGHSLIRRTMQRMDSTFRETHVGVQLRETFFNPDML